MDSYSAENQGESEQRRLWFRRQRGQILIAFTLVAFVLFGMLGLVVDLGWMYYLKKSAQAAADAAAIAGAHAAFIAAGGPIASCTTNVVCQAATACPSSISNPPTSNIGNACLYARANGFTTGGHSGRQNVTVAAGKTLPPPTVPGVQSVSYWVTVRVAETVPQLFSAILGNRTGVISARATAGVRSSGGGGGGCVYVLSPSGTGVSMSGTASIQSGCGIYVDSNGSAAVLLSGSPRITVTGGAGVNIVGGIVKSGSPVISPAPTLGAAYKADPFAGLLTPPSNINDPCKDAGNPVNLSGSQTRTLIPGVYCSAINMSGSASVTFNPGTFILKGGVNMSGSTRISGTGVTLYAPSSGIAMSGTGGINLSAPTSGPYQGIVIYQPTSNHSGMTLSGGSNQTLTGVIYEPGGGLTYSGGSTTNATSTTLVVNTITFSGSSNIKNAANTGGGTGAGTGGMVLLIE